MHNGIKVCDNVDNILSSLYFEAFETSEKVVAYTHKIISIKPVYITS